jgi:hypothetical protein
VGGVATASWLRHTGSCSRNQLEGARENAAEDCVVIVILDTAGVEGLAPVDEKRRARLRVLRQQVTDFVVPAAALAECV